MAGIIYRYSERYYERYYEITTAPKQCNYLDDDRERSGRRSGKNLIYVVRVLFGE